MFFSMEGYMWGILSGVFLIGIYLVYKGLSTVANNKAQQAERKEYFTKIAKLSQEESNLIGKSYSDICNNLGGDYVDNKKTLSSIVDNGDKITYRTWMANDFELELVFDSQDKCVKVNKNTIKNIKYIDGEPINFDE